jgi:transposase
MKVSTTGLDLAKNVFSVHAIDDRGTVVVRRSLRRAQVAKFFSKLEPCLVGMEASSGAHYWARELKKMGHDARLMPAMYVKAYVKRGKNDAIDAAANCEAVSRPTMRFVPVKSVEQQGALALHRARDLMVTQKTQTSNALRAICAEFGVVAAKGRMSLCELFEMIADEGDGRLPDEARLALKSLAAQHTRLSASILALERQIVLKHAKDQDCRRLMTIPGIGPLSASALILKIGDVSRFDSSRDLAAWIGLTPKAHSTGGKQKLGSISKQGDRYLRKLLVQCASSLLRLAKAKTSNAPLIVWLRQLLERKPKKLAILALANKLARIAWALLAKGGTYDEQANKALKAA